MRVIQVRVQNGTVLDVANLMDDEIVHVYDHDLVDEPEMATLTKVHHPQWGPAIVSTYNPRLKEPWR